MVETKQKIEIGPKAKPGFDNDLQMLICKYTGWDPKKIDIREIEITSGRNGTPLVSINVCIKE